MPMQEALPPSGHTPSGFVGGCHETVCAVPVAVIVTVSSALRSTPEATPVPAAAGTTTVSVAAWAG